MSARNYGLLPGSYRNIRVVVEENILKIRLHGNEIITFDVERGTAKIWHCGHRTMTSTNAINRFLRLMGDHRYIQIKEHTNYFVPRGVDPQNPQAHTVYRYMSNRDESRIGNQLFLRDHKRNTSKQMLAPLTVSFSGRQMFKFLSAQQGFLVNARPQVLERRERWRVVGQADTAGQITIAMQDDDERIPF